MTRRVQIALQVLFSCQFWYRRGWEVYYLWMAVNVCDGIGKMGMGVIVSWQMTGRRTGVSRLHFGLRYGRDREGNVCIMAVKTTSESRGGNVSRVWVGSEQTAGGPKSLFL